MDRMSFNNMKYDSCTYTKDLKENVSILTYLLSPFRYEHQEKCRHKLGLVGGTAVSHIDGNLVDLESDLRGQTRYLSWCTKTQAAPLKEGEHIVNDKTEPISTSKKHLPACQFISYKEVPLPPSVNYARC
jgi:hypothetical protein